MKHESSGSSGWPLGAAEAGPIKAAHLESSSGTFGETEV